ncbi:hypothetical protein M758_4G031800 [Ceratodon purpureus]|uniref:Uncharacterized protein n=1 Tax=Ceratodon purpureus TaxID=3225 RepID=A0A8T0I7X4_CERPU|nr:hypothetical protein KC19_4G035200 [Ceratodon purpureus]KAG0618002.1 hypothetical protein M758_4G031800 [Ceratodon purpureus]
MGESEATNSWKVMFYEALSSMKGLEKEIVHKDGEIQSLKRRIRVSESGLAIPPASSESKERLMDEVKDLKGEVKVLQELAHNLNSKLIAAEACLQQSLERNVKLEEEKNIEKQHQEVLNAAFEGLKAEVEDVLTETEAFKAEAVHSMQALTTDVRRYQAASELKIQSLRHKVEKMEDLQGVQNGVLRTIAEEQEILRLICITRAAMQQSTAASLQHLAKLEQFCGKTIQKSLSMVDSARTKMLHNSQQVSEKMVQLEAMVTKHKRELSQAEKNLLESLASQTSLRGLPSEDNNGANLEHGLPDCNQVRLKTPAKRHAVIEAEEMSTSARTSSTKEIHKQANMNQTLPTYSQHEHAKRKLETSKQLHNFEVLRSVRARPPSLSRRSFRTYQERTEVSLLLFLNPSTDYHIRALLLF